MTRISYVPLSIKLGAIVLAAVTVTFGFVYLWVVPRLESRLVDAKIRELDEASRGLAFQLDTVDLRRRPSRPIVLDSDLRRDRLRTASNRNNARVVIFQRVGEEFITVFDDSNQVSSDGIAADEVAARAAATRRRAVGRVERDGQEFAEVALPLQISDNLVLLLSARLDDVLAGVAPVRRNILLAGGIGLGVAWFAGSMAALRLVRRIRRLEEAAVRIAKGDLTVPVRDEGRDEIGQLAEAFERMRARLANVEKARRAFIANASHELKTPLFALGGFIELMQHEDLDEATRQEFTEQMDDQVQRLTRLASDLLDLSQLDAGQLEVASAPIDLGQCATDLVEQFAPAAESGGYHLELGPVLGAPLGLGDAPRVLRIGSALIENALRHTLPGTTVDVTVARSGGWAELRVADNGPGVSEDDLPRLFERFYRGGSPAAFGSGLGLAIARELAERMDGTLEAGSRPGHTVFTLRLPAAGAATFSREKTRDLQPQT